MAFRLPANLAVGQEYTATSPSEVTALEQSLPAGSRVLVALTFSERYDGFEADCERANEALLADGRFSPWSDYPRFVTPDPDGDPVAWVSYQSSPAWWMLILVILGGIFALPIIGAFGAWIIDLMVPGFTEMMTMMVMLMIMGGVMLFVPKLMAPAKEGK